MCIKLFNIRIIYDVYILNIKPYFTHNREMTPRKKLKQTLMDHYYMKKEGYKSD